MERVEKAVSLFENGLNCSQALLAVFGEPYGMGLEEAVRLGRPLGAGLARMAMTCGAVSGAIMVLGLALGDSLPEGEARNAIAESARELVRRFAERHRTTLCKELLGADMSTEMGLKKIKEEKLVARICPQFVRSAAKILVDLQPIQPNLNA